MALDKVVDSSSLDAGMTSVADTIRAKAGTTDQLLWPDGFMAAIEAISGGGGTGLAYDMGEFVLEADTVSGSSAPIYISHNFGEKPGFILVWTDDYVGVTNPDANFGTNLGFVWLNQLMGLDNWFTSVASGEGTTVLFTQTKGSSGMNVVKPTSAAYTLKSAQVSSESFKLTQSSATIYWRSGTTYKYFVSKAWWNIGGVASAE